MSGQIIKPQGTVGVMWCVIPGFRRYSASSDGQIRRDEVVGSWAAGIVKQHRDDRGYWRCDATSDEGDSRTRFAHQLIALAFIGPQPDGMVVCHGPAGNVINAPGNLSYGTQAANVEDMRRDGTMQIGEKCVHSKLNELQVIEILGLLANRELKRADIAARYGIDKTAIDRIASGKAWAHIPRPFNPSELARRKGRSPCKECGAAAASYRCSACVRLRRAAGLHKEYPRKARAAA